MRKLAKLIFSPCVPPVEVVGDIVLALHSPGQGNSVMIEVNPNIQDYKEKADTNGINIRQQMVTTPSSQGKMLTFDLGPNRKHRVHLGDSDHDIELMRIGKEKIEGQDWRFYEFSVSTPEENG